jgi:hypothetical protein
MARLLRLHTMLHNTTIATSYNTKWLNYRDTYILHTYIHTYTHTCIHTYIHTSIHTYLHTYIHTYDHIYVHECVHTYIHSYIHTYIFTFMHTYIRTYILTWIHMNITCSSLSAYLVWKRAVPLYKTPLNLSGDFDKYFITTWLFVMSTCYLSGTMHAVKHTLIMFTYW